ncbi:MAG TPA: hypothetical protein ENO09_00055 [bacterium]|nr:hypothetical protein [bacterium]
MNALLHEQQALLARQLIVLQRLQNGLLYTHQRLPQILDIDDLEQPELAERVAALNDRFTKLQDQFAAALRHAHSMTGERYRSFLDVTIWAVQYDIIATPEDWLELRALRNRLTHDYDLDYADVIEIIHTLRTSIANLTGMTERFAHFCQHHGLLPA